MAEIDEEKCINCGACQAKDVYKRQDLVSLINQKGARAVGISGMDAHIIEAVPYQAKGADLGLSLIHIFHDAVSILMTGHKQDLFMTIGDPIK